MKNDNKHKDIEIDEFKSMIKDLNNIINDLNKQKISQTDYIKIIKKLDNLESDLQNLNTVAQKMCSSQWFEVDNLFDYQKPKNYGDKIFTTLDLDNSANILNKLCTKIRNKVSEYAALQMGENCKLN